MRHVGYSTSCMTVNVFMHLIDLLSVFFLELTNFILKRPSDALVSSVKQAIG